MGLFTEDKPHSAVTEWILRLSGESYTEDDLSDIFELCEAVHLQDSGPREAARALRKRLKYGNLHSQLRALTIIDALVNNGDKHFLQQFADEPLIERMRIIVSDPLTDEQLREKLETLINGWKNYVGLGTLYSCVPHSRKDKHPPPRPPKTFSIPQSSQNEGKSRNTLKKEKPKLGKVLNDKAKNYILTTIAAANQASTQLSNALQSVNSETNSIAHEPTVLAKVSQAKKSRKEIIRLIQHVETEDFIGTLIHANEELVSALQLFEVLKNQVYDDSDSDTLERDEELEERIRQLIEATEFEKPPEMPPRPPRLEPNSIVFNEFNPRSSPDISLSSLAIRDGHFPDERDNPFKTPVNEELEVTWQEFARESKP